MSQFTSGTEKFIDLSVRLDTDTVVDNINCTGEEQNLSDCPFSNEVSDCQERFHRVGVQCHEESECTHSLLGDIPDSYCTSLCRTSSECQCRIYSLSVNNGAVGQAREGTH